MYQPNWEVSFHGQVAFPSFLQRIYSVFGCGVASVIRHGITPARLGRRLADDEFRGVRWWCFYALRQVRHDDGRLPSAWQTYPLELQAQIDGLIDLDSLKSINGTVWYTSCVHMGLELAGFSAVVILISSLCCGDFKEVAILYVAVFFF